MTKAFNKRYWITQDLAEDLTQLANSMYSKDDPATEIMNPKPLLEILGLRKPLTMEQKLERLFRGPRGLIQQMYDQGEETPEEMNDLDIDDDIEPLSPYEYQIMREETNLYRQQYGQEDVVVAKKTSEGTKPDVQENASVARSPEASGT